MPSGLSPSDALEALNAAVSFAVITVLFAALYRVLPDVENSRTDVWIVAVVTAGLFTLGKSLLG